MAGRVPRVSVVSTEARPASRSQRRSLIPVASLYSGAGGLDLGLEHTGSFRTAVFVENEEHAIETLDTNFTGEVLGESIEDLHPFELLEAGGIRPGEDFLLAAGPPCQPWSKAGFWLEEKRLGAKDPRATTLDQFLRVLRLTRPRAFIFENVWGLKYRTHAQVLERLLARMKALGYTTSAAVLNAADYGVPQRRHRLIVVGAYGRDAKFKFPTPGYGTDHRDHPTAGAAIAELGERSNPPEPDEQVNGKWGDLLPRIPPGENYLVFTQKRGWHGSPRFTWRSRYWSFLLKLDPDRPSWTIPAHPGPYTGPFHWANRRLRIAEIKRLQTFPHRFTIHGELVDQRRQLGNAVPPRLAEVVGRAVAQQLF